MADEAQIVNAGATTPEGQQAYEQFILGSMNQPPAAPIQGYQTPIKANVAAPGNESQLMPGSYTPYSPMDPIKGAGGPQDIATLQQQLPPVASEPTAATEEPKDFATPTTTSVAQMQTPDMSQFTKPLDAKQDANRAIATATRDKAIAEKNQLAVDNIALAEQAAKQQELQNKFTEEFNKTNNYMKSLQDQLAAQDFSAPKLNTNRFWENQSTTGKIAAGIAVALGGIGGALARDNSNVGLDMINKAIDRDIAEQKFNIEQGQESKKLKAQNLRDQASLGNNMLQELRAKFTSDLSAENALKLLMLEQSQNKLKSIASGYDSDVMKAKVKSLNADIDMQKQALQMQIKQQLVVQSLTSGLLHGSGDITKLTPAQLVAMGAPKELAHAVSEEQSRRVTGFNGLAPDKEAAAKFRERTAEQVPALDSLKRIQQMKKDYNKFDMSPEGMKKRAAIQSEIAGLVGALRLPLTGPGILTDSERAMLQEAIGDPTKLFSISSVQDARMNQIMKKIQSDIDSQAKLYGLSRVNSEASKFVKPIK